jgi:hypothetical protein
MRRAFVVLLAATLAAGCGAKTPAGRYLVYTRDQAVWIAHVDGTRPRLLVRTVVRLLRGSLVLLRGCIPDADWNR